LLIRGEWTYNINSLGYGVSGVVGSTDRAVNSMKRLSELLRSRDITLSIGVYPWPNQIFNDSMLYNKQRLLWKNFCKDVSCERFIDGFEVFDEILLNNSRLEIYRNYYIEGDVHFNINGNKLISNLLEKSLH
jgi:hypothetical protein